MAIRLNFILVICEVIAFIITFRKKKQHFYLYYTQISNFICLISSLCLLIFGQRGWVSVMRYLSTTMLTITFLITVCVLLPTMKSSILGKPCAHVLGCFAGNRYHGLWCGVDLAEL